MSIDDVTDLTPRVQYTALAAQDEFDYPFPIFEDADLVVDIDGEVQTLTTDYTVDGEGEDLGGTVTLVTPLSGGEIVTIYRDTAIERTADFQQNGPFASVTMNDEIDKLYIIAQELKAKIGRAIRFPFTAAQTDAQSELSPLSNWYDKFLYIGSTGLLEAAATISGVVALTASLIGSLIYPRTTAETTAGVTPTQYWYQPGDVRRYGAVGDDATNNDGAFADARLQREAGGAEVYIPPGTYRLAVAWTWTVHAKCAIRGDNWVTTSLKWTAAVNGLVISSNHARVEGILLDGNSVGLSGLVEHNSAQSVFVNVAAQNWTVDGNRISTVFDSPTGNCNFSRHEDCTFTDNAGWGSRMPSVQGDQNAISFSDCNFSGNTLGGLLIKGQANRVVHGLFEGNTGPAISWGEDTDVIVVSRNSVHMPYIESNTTGIYGAITSSNNYGLIDNLNVNSGYTSHATAAHTNRVVFPYNSGLDIGYGYLKVATNDTFTGTLTGMTDVTTGTVYYEIDGNVCTLRIIANITGTSNSTAMTMTGLPSIVRPVHQVIGTSIGLDNGANVVLGALIAAGGSSITFLTDADFSSTGFTGSGGTKGLIAGWTFQYSIA